MSSDNVPGLLQRQTCFVLISSSSGLDPYIPQYDQHVNGPPQEPRQAFVGPTYYEDDHIYEEPAYIPASLPQTRLITPRRNQTRALIPTQYATGYVGRPKARPTSASQHPGTVRTASTRPISARTDPMPRYTPSPVRSSPPDRGAAPPALPVRLPSPLLSRDKLVHLRVTLSIIPSLS